MHRYEPEWPADLSRWDPPSPTAFTFRDALDVGRFAAIDALNTWYTYPHVWHLDAQGRWRCCSKGSSLHSVRRFAKEPEDMLACRWEKPRRRCPNFWVVLEPRHEWLGDRYEVTEADAAAFLEL